ncbi:MAG: acyl-[acyl-carrier-protein]--UDP-N-acetylglucosamine O-acyltransferase [Pelagibacteraceae bacterium]|nr:acyl-[acyl-carrier-protein]--UDP-N-acetylglucosamine O-acyltransferase [Pelagibacteraceae bacterium]|tara:strand:+ start:9686 stop:10471 length:786 start_codon:yes stop_codon:yes gene_type:complete
MIHPSSIISNKAEIDPSTNIGPYCIIGDNVKIGNENVLISHVNIVGNTEIGNGNKFYPFSSIGTNPQDLKYKGEKSYIKIGNYNTFRESVTVNPGTQGGGLHTIIKNNCLFMVGAHIAHDCQIRSNVILANNATLAGHVEIDDYAIIGGNSAVHQFVNIGKNAMIGGMSGVEKNIIPYGLYTGIRCNLKGLNIVGLKRKGLSNKDILTIRTATNSIFNINSSIEVNIKDLDDKLKLITEIKDIINFILKNKKRGICVLSND